jgi:hypothetical protein
LAVSTEPIRHEIGCACRRLGALHRSHLRSVLGPGHELTRRTELLRTLVVQATTTAGTGAVGGIAIAAGLAWGATLFRVAMIVELVLIVVLVITLRLQREGILRVIVGGEEHLLDEVEREARRIASRGHLSELADRLELALKHAREWHQPAATARPRRGVQLLRSFAREVDEIVLLLRSRAATPQGVALLELLLNRLYGSTLYPSETELEQELWRIRYLLNLRPGRQDPDREIQAASESA